MQVRTRNQRHDSFLFEFSTYEPLNQKPVTLNISDLAAGEGTTASKFPATATLGCANVQFRRRPAALPTRVWYSRTRASFEPLNYRPPLDPQRSTAQFSLQANSPALRSEQPGSNQPRHALVAQRPLHQGNRVRPAWKVREESARDLRHNVPCFLFAGDAFTRCWDMNVSSCGCYLIECTDTGTFLLLH